jgi:predicted transcriptional regulator
LPRVRRRYRLRGRHARERAVARVVLPLAVAEAEIAEDRIVLATLRTRPRADLDAAQVAASAGLPPSTTAPALDRLVRLGLVREGVVGGRPRYGLS